MGQSKPVLMLASPLSGKPFVGSPSSISPPSSPSQSRPQAGHVGPPATPPPAPDVGTEVKIPEPVAPRRNVMRTCRSASSTPNPSPQKPRKPRKSDLSLETSLQTDDSESQLESPTRITTNILPSRGTSKSLCINPCHSSDNIAWTLYEELGYDLGKWLKKLGIPCSVHFPTDTRPLDMATMKQALLDTLTPCEACYRRPKPRRPTKDLKAIDGGKTVRASELKLRVMEERCNWTFRITGDTVSLPDKKQPRRKSRSHLALHDIRILPQVANGNDLTYDIRLALKKEKTEMENGKLILSKEWQQRIVGPFNETPPRSSKPRRSKIGTSNAPSTNVKEAGPSLTIVSETMKLGEGPDYCAIWSLVYTIDGLSGIEDALEWKPQAEIEVMDQADRIGNVTAHEGTSGVLVQQIITDFLTHRCDCQVTSEIQVETGCGTLIYKVLTRKDIADKRNQRLRFPQLLRVLGRNPFPDIQCRANSRALLPWHDELQPVALAAEGKPDKNKSKNHQAQLSAYFNATLILLILYYLDTRQSLDATLPPWLYVYGIFYTEFGFSIYAHYPYYRTDEGWGFVSELVTDAFKNIFRSETSDVLRVRALGALFRIKSRAYYLLEQLSQWENSEQVLAPLEDNTAK